MDGLELTYKMMKRKKSAIVMATLFSFSLYIGLAAFLYYEIQIELQLLITIYLPLSIGFLFLLSYFQTKIVYYRMMEDYYQMLLDKMPVLKLSKKIYNRQWESHILELGFELERDFNSYQLYYQFSSKIKGLGSTGHVLTVIVVAKSEGFDFYNQSLSQEIEKLFIKYKQQRQVKKQIVLQFSAVDTITDQTILNANKIINYKQSNHYFINLNVVYGLDKNEVYYLRPSKRYPSKFYYYAIRTINELCYISED